MILEILRRAGRLLLLMLCVAAGTILLVRYAPGFFADEREMDAKYAATARAEMQPESQMSLRQVAGREVKGWAHGDLGESRQYAVPVTELILPRIQVSAWLLLRGIFYGWLLALCAALPVSAVRRGGSLLGLPFTLLLAMPTAALATACILAETGGPVLVLSLLVAAREFKFLRAMLRGTWSSPHVLQGRAQGLPLHALLRTHIVPGLAPQLYALATLSIVTALGALVSLEVIFNVPGLGQLAWSAVMNRDLPVLVAVSLLMACAIGFAGMISRQRQTLEAAA